MKEDKRIKKGKQEAGHLLKIFNPKLFTKKQLDCLKLRADGYSLQEIANVFKTTRQDISLAIIASIKKGQKIAKKFQQ